MDASNAALAGSSALRLARLNGAIPGAASAYCSSSARERRSQDRTMAKWNWRGPGAQLALNYTPLMLWFSAIAISQISNQHHHPPESAEEYAAVLEDPGRDAWQKPMEVVLAMTLGASDVVADIGAGTGYFARRFAHHAAKVYAVDIDSKLLD